jgi:hypothetical protein
MAEIFGMTQREGLLPLINISRQWVSQFWLEIGTLPLGAGDRVAIRGAIQVLSDDLVGLLARLDRLDEKSN